MTSSVRRARSWFARPLPYAVALLALPLLAPTCGGQEPGVKAFSKGSVVIPMDACYQGNAGIPPTDCVTPGGTVRDTGDVIKAYGLAYQLIKNDISVYWVIAQGKGSLTDVDATVSYAGGSPVGVYNWATGTVGAMPPNNAGHSIDYRGGPFVVDGSDWAAVLNLFQNGNAATGTPALQTLYSGVKVHVTNVAFQGNVSQVFAGGWNAGGAVAPKLALLNIGSNNAANNDRKNSFPIIQGYLTNANLNFAGAGGVATDTGHGAIYDALLMPDFQPVGAGDWTTSNLGKYGYKVLWVPHWWAPGSCADVTSDATCTGTRYAPALIGNVLKTVGGFVRASNDLMAECAGFGSFEGVWTGAAATHADFGAGDPLSQFQATQGFGIKNLVSPRPAPAYTSFASPLMQIGDFPFTAATGAIENYQPSAARSSAFRAGVQQLVSTEADAWNYFTFQPRGTLSAQAGSVAYLAGHDYSSGNQPVNFAGQRLVLNTLFNLSAACKERNTPCQQLKNLGVCRPGTWKCCEAADIANGYCEVAGEPVCRPNNGPSAEVCDGLDNNCDGIVDNVVAPDPHVVTPACYDGPPGTVDGSGNPKGVCQKGAWTCQQTGTPQAPSAAWTCLGEVLPGTEICNGLDDDCNGVVDDPGALTPPGGNPACFTGPPDAVMQSTFPPSQCKPGTWACVSASWACNGQQLPQQEQCEGILKDYNCNGVVGDGCQCVIGTTRTCPWPGPGTPGIGICRAGTQACVQDPQKASGQGMWAGCAGQVPAHTTGGVATEICGNGLDDDCNGIVDDPDQCAECQSGQTRKCYPAGTTGCTGSPGGPYTCQGVCAAGVETCVAGTWSGQCTGAITPSPELCDGLDNTCSGPGFDEGNAPCPGVLKCVNGVCTQPTWGGETDCLPGYVHSGGGTSGTCVAQSCPAAPCPAGRLCQGGNSCNDLCQGKTCGDGAFCSIGMDGQPTCIGGGCYATGCTGTDVCRNGTCQADVCAGIACPAGTFCRGNYALSPPAPDCVRACSTVTCPTGQACGSDGFCAPDPCATVACPTGQVCRSSGSSTTCIDDPCPTGRCGANQACVDGRCTDDPCAGITCPAGVCARGQCYPSNNTNGYGPQPGASPSKGGCGCGGGDAGPTALLLSLAALPLAGRRRRRPFRGGRALRGGAAVLLAGLMALGAGCSKKKSAPSNCESCGTDHCVDLKFDAAHCASCGTACAGGEVCVDLVCITASAQVPSISGVSPAPVAAHTSQTFTIAGDRFQSGAKLRLSGAGLAASEVSTSFGSSTQLTAAVDLSAAAPGTLSLQVANPDHTTSNTATVEVVTPTPVVDAISPTSALAGTRPPIHVTGSAFTSSAICVQRAGAVDTFIPPDSAPSSTALDCTLDLGAVAPQTIQIIVQNENLVQSAPRPFEVTTSTPALSSLSPNPAKQGEEIRLVITGTGFVPGSRAQIDQGAGYVDLLTDFVASTLLQAQLSLAAFAAGSYPVRVSNPGVPAPSSSLTLQVDPTAPLATGLVVTPASPRVGDTGVGLALSGAGFTASCQVEVLRPGGAWLGPPDVVTGAGTTPSAIQATTDMAGNEGIWYARVSCPAGCSSAPCLTTAFPFQVATNAASLATVTPAGGAQGATVPVTVTGANFAPGMALRLSGAAADLAATLDATTPGTKATASIPLAGLDVGSHLLQAVNLGAAASNGIAFSVTPGAPSISGTSTSCSPSPGCSAACTVQQVTPVTITISGSNFGTGISTVFAEPPAPLPRTDLSTVPNCTVAVVDASTIQVILDTTQVLPADYTLTVENPGRPASNAVPYRVKTTSCP